ncbi:MAG: hypothetical protein UY89_C0021G0002 [Parcubacteria group bacterium GW2011_GWA1_54_9]|nr:MAG: hypothetical protein UY89_C0021G0002 [Parcubacteria group bacterium GW2011_GWA1_54_9]
MPGFLRRRWQLAQIKRLVALAYGHVPAYRTLWRATGIEPERIRTFFDFATLPVTDKQFFRKHREEEIVHDSFSPGGYYFMETSGSTGEPFRFPRSTSHYLQRRFRHAKAFDFGMLRFLFWRGFSRHEIFDMKLAEIRINPRRGAPYCLYLPTADMRNDPAGVLRALREFEPDVLNSRPTVLVELARLAERLPREERPRLRFVLSHGEELMPSQREYIRDVFGCDMHEFYGLTEVGAIGGDCEVHHGLHLFEETCFVEVVDAEGRPLPAGEFGRVVVTHFYNHALPFIRYDTGDSGVILDEPCPCGLRARRLIVRGRLGGFFTIGGKRFNYSEFQMILSGFSTIVLRYQFAKVSKEAVELRIIPAPAYSAEEALRLRQAFRDTLGIEPVVKVVDNIPYTDGGKTRFIVDETAR